jgi:hypothetical protein
MRLRFHSTPAFVRSGSPAVWLAGVVLGLCLQVVCVTARADAQHNLPAGGAPFAIADFDGDKLPDLATVQVAQIRNSETQYGIRFELSSGARQSIDITAPVGGLQLTSRDVNGDNFLDVVVTTTLLHRPVAVLLNDGHGNFALKDPASFPEAIWTAESLWTAAAQQVYDASLNLPPRSPNGDCGEAASLFSPRVAHGIPGLAVCRGPAFAVVIPVLGRAPPTFVHHV